MEFPVLQFVSVASWLVTGHYGEESGSVFFTLPHQPNQIFMQMDKIPLSSFSADYSLPILNTFENGFQVYLLHHCQDEVDNVEFFWIFSFDFLEDGRHLLSYSPQ